MSSLSLQYFHVDAIEVMGKIDATDEGELPAQSKSVFMNAMLMIVKIVMIMP